MMMEVITEEAAESSRHDIFLCSLHDFSKNVKAKTNRTFLREKTRIFRSRKYFWVAGGTTAS